MNTNNNGENFENAKPEDANKENPKLETEGTPKEVASLGISEDGYIVAKILANQTPWTIIGFFDDAKSWYRGQVLQAKKQAEASKIVKPGWRGFNPSKWRR